MKKLYYLFVLLIFSALFSISAEAQVVTKFATLFGGTGTDLPLKSEVKDGYNYLLFHTDSPNIPVTNGSTLKGGGDYVYMKLDSATQDIIYASYIGSDAGDASAISYAPLMKVIGNYIYISLVMDGANAPTTDGSNHLGSAFSDYFIKINATTGVPVYASYITGGEGSLYQDFIVEGNSIYISGAVFGSNIIYPTTDGSSYPDGLFTNSKSYFKKINNTNYTTEVFTLHDLFNGENFDEFMSKSKIYKSGNNIYSVIGTVCDPEDNLPTIPCKGSNDILVYKINASTGQFDMEMIVGGSLDEFYKDHVIIGNKLYLTGTTKSFDFPTTDGTTVQNQFYGGDLFYTVINLDTKQILTSTILKIGNSGNASEPKQLIVEGNGAYIVGFTTESQFTSTNGTKHTGKEDIFYYKLNATTGAVLAKSIFGSAEQDYTLFSFVGIPKVFQKVCDKIHIAVLSGGYMPVTSGVDISASPAVYPLYVILDEATGSITYSTYLGPGNARPQTINIENNKAYFSTNISSPNKFTTTVPDPTKGGDYDVGYTVLDLLPDFINTDIDDVSPSTQTVCKLGNIGTLSAPNIIFKGENMPRLYSGTSPILQKDIEAIYQWQGSSSASGPWTDLPIGSLRIFKPEPVNSNTYYRRVSLNPTSASCDKDTVSISSVATVNVNTKVAPTVKGGGPFNTCALSSINIGGSPTATGGLAPYTYKWYLGDDTSTVVNTSANFSVTVPLNTIYTVYVKDANNCEQYSQASVVINKANAGPDVFACATDSVRIKASTIQGLTGVTYSWSPTAGLSCTTCLQPNAKPSSTTNYVLTTTIPKTGGGTCASKDTVKVSVNSSYPIPNFAGPDRVICFDPAGNTTTTLGTPAQYGFVPIYGVTQSSAVGGYTGTVANLSDGLYTTGARTQVASGNYITLDLGAEYSIGKVQLAAISAANLNGKGIRASTDNINFDYVIQITGATNNNLKTINFDEPVTLRYLQIYFINSGTVDLSEIKIFKAYNYTWSPAKYLSNNKESAITFNSGTIFPVSKDSSVYYLTAEIDGCVFSDTVVVNVIAAFAGVDGCGPRVVGQSRTDVSGLAETFKWTKISGGGTITGSTTTPTTTVSASPTGQPTTYQLATTYKGVTCTDLVVVDDCQCVVNIDVESPLSCATTREGDVVKLHASSSPSENVTYTWTPNVGLSAYTGATVTLTDTVSRTYTCTMQSTLDPSVTCSETITVNIPAYQRPVFDAVKATICAGTTINVGQSTVAGYSYLWNDTTLSSTTISNPTATPLTNKSYIVKVTDIGTGCTVKDTAVIQIREVPLKPGDDYYVCSNAIIQLGGDTSKQDMSYLWTPNSPWQNGTDSSSAQPDVLVSTNLTFYLTATDTITGCFKNDTIQVFVNDNPSIPNAPDVTICKGDSVLIGSDPLPGVNYSWTPSTGLSSPNSSKTYAKANSTTTYTLVATFPGSCAATASDQVKVTVNNTSFTIPDITYCPSSGAVSLGAAAPTGKVSYSWSPSALVSNPNIRNPQTLNPPPNSKTDFILTVTDANGCIDKDTMSIIPRFDPPIAGADANVCINQTKVLGSSLNTTGPGITYAWTPTTGLSCSTCPSPTFTPTALGTTTYTLTKKSTSPTVCTSTATVKVTVVDFKLPALPSPTVCRNSCVQIGYNPEANVTYSWSPTTGLSASDISNPIVCLTTTGRNYTLTGTSLEGCTDSKTISVSVSPTNPPVINMVDTILVPILPTTVSANPTITSGSGNYNYSWTPNLDGSISNPNILNPSFFIGSTPKDYTLEVTDRNTGCTAQDVVSIRRDALVPFECDQTTFFLNGPTNNVSLYERDLFTGTNTLITTTGRQANSLAYNPIDNHLYMLMYTAATGGTNRASLTRISANGELRVLDIPNLASALGTNPTTGGFTSDGYYVSNTSANPSNRYVTIDVNPNRVTYLQIVDPTAGYTPINSAPYYRAASSLILSADWAYRPSDGLFYGLVENPFSADYGKIVTLNIETGVQTLGALPLLYNGNRISTGNSTLGSIFIDANENIYTVSTSGSTYLILLNTAEAILINSSSASNNVDGTNCPTTVISFPIQGNVFNDINGLLGNPFNTVDGIPTNVSNSLKAVLYNNSTGKVEAIAPIAANGKYAFGVHPGDNYSVILTMTSPTIGSTTKPTSILPSGWVSTGENIGTNAGNDGNVNGVIDLGSVNAPITQANFGIEQPPVAGNGVNYAPNPDGTIQVTVPTNTFTNGSNSTDPAPGAVTSIRITAFPAGATSIVINGTSYTSATFPPAGITILTDVNGNPSQTITVDPTANGVTSVTIPFKAIDAAGKESANTGTAILYLTGISIGGNVYNDANGLNPTPTNTVDGVGTNAGGLNAVLLDSLNNVVAVVPIGSDGTYNFNDQTIGTYSVSITTANPSIGSSNPTVTLPAGWVNTGEKNCVVTVLCSGSDGTVDGKLSLGRVTSDITQANFGIERTPVADNKIYNIPNNHFDDIPPSLYPNISTPGAKYFNIPTSSPNLTGYTNNGRLTGSDAEDCAQAQSCNTASNFKINSINPGTRLFYNYGGEVGIVELSSNATIPNYDPSKLLIYAIEGSGMTDQPIGFTYSLIDAAGKESPPATYTILTESALPVELLYFTSTLANCKVRLDWATASELNNDYFEIQRSSNFSNWETIGMVVGNGNSNKRINYHFVDANILSGIIYYRLKQVDYDGTVEYHSIISTDVTECSNEAVKIFPVPAQNILNVTLSLIDLQKVQFTIVDVSGKRIRTLTNVNATNQIDLSNIPNGSYFLQINSSNNQLVSYPFSIVK
jgi:hypothetical protein